MTDDTGLVHAFLLDGKGGGTPLDWDGIARWRRGDGLLWIHLDYAGDDAQVWLGERAGLDPVLCEALLDKDPRPRALAVSDNLLLVVRGINPNQDAQPEDMVSVRSWIEPDRVITLRHRRMRTLQAVAESLRVGTGPRDAGDFVAELVERVLDPVVACVDLLDDDVAALEEVSLGDDDPALRARLADLRRRAISLRRFIGPQRDAFGRLAALTAPWADERARGRLREAADRLTRTIEELDAARDRAAVTHDELTSRLSELSNKRLYVLSLITALFLPLGFVCSLLGVNVGGMPGRDIEWGFWFLCAMLIVALAMQLWIFRRWKWL